MNKEFNLSEKTANVYDHYLDGNNFIVIRATDIKEAVKKLKEELGAQAIGSDYADKVIDKIFGPKLTK